MEFLQLVVTEGVYFFYGYRFSFFQVDSWIDAWSVWPYIRFFPFFEHIQQVVVFLRDRVSYVLVFVVLLVFYRQLCANVDSF